jgi:hypothetical protein
MHVFDITHATAAEAITRGRTPLLSFADFTVRVSPPDGHFEPACVRDPKIFAAQEIFFSATIMRLPETLMVASAFFFFRTSIETSNGRGP